MPDAKAGYRFIPLNSQIIPPPLKFREISHAKPLKDGLCGVIDVTWTAETPVCVGMSVSEPWPSECGNAPQEQEVINPFSLAGRPALPGSSLKGMIRSVLEIATFSHLGQINAHHRFGYRNFNDTKYYRTVIKANDIKAGWLIYDNHQWHMKKAQGSKGFFLVDISARERSIPRLTGNPASPKVSYEIDSEGQVTSIQPIDAIPRLSQQGFLIPGGRVSNKKKEAVFAPVAKNSRYPLSLEAMRNFAFINSKPSRNRMQAEGNWAMWLRKMNYPDPFDKRPRTEGSTGVPPLPGIPVYYCGNPAEADKGMNETFFMGLSRVIKIPYKYSVGEIAANSLGSDEEYRRPKMNSNKFDFARAIFGDVEDVDVKKQPDQADRKALKGRVAFEFALAEPKSAMTEPQAAVFMGPRASYWPFYLGNKLRSKCPTDYNTDQSILAGRKRYPLQDKARNIHNPDANPDMKTCIRFLEAGARFRGRIRFHNLHPGELGALLWAIHLGHEEGRSRHSIGRAKAFGYGRLKCEYSLSAKSNMGNGENPETRAEVFMGAFEEYMEAKFDSLGSWRESVQVRNLIAMSTPAAGTALINKLEYMSLEKFAQLKKNPECFPDYAVEFQREEEGYTPVENT